MQQSLSARLKVFHADQAFEILCNALPGLGDETNRKISHASLPYLSNDLATKEKDWYEVKKYMERLNLVDASFDINKCYTNSLVPKEAIVWSKLKQDRVQICYSIKKLLVQV